MEVLNDKEIAMLPELDTMYFSDKLYCARVCSDYVNYVLILQLHITDFCNLSCTHCYGEVDKHQMSMRQFTDIIDDFFLFMRKHKLAARIHITGGEPLVHQDFYNMLEYLWSNYYVKEYPFVVEILSNGTLLEQDNIDRLNEYKKMIYEFQLSVDGMEEKHDAIRGKGSWKKTISSTELLIKNEFRVSWSFVISKINYGEATKILNLAENIKVSRVTISRLIPLGMNAFETYKYILTGEEFREVQKSIYNVASEMFERVRRGKSSTYLAMNRCDLWHLADIDYIKNQINLAKSIPSYLVLGCSCMIGRNYMVILPNGNMLACRRLPKVIGNVYENSIGEIWRNNNFLKDVRMRQAKMEGKCKQCEFYTNARLKNLCGGGGPCMSVALGMSIYEPDPMCWKE